MLLSTWLSAHTVWLHQSSMGQNIRHDLRDSDCLLVGDNLCSKMDSLTNGQWSIKRKILAPAWHQSLPKLLLQMNYSYEHYHVYVIFLSLTEVAFLFQFERHSLQDCTPPIWLEGKSFKVHFRNRKMMFPMCIYLVQKKSDRWARIDLQEVDLSGSTRQWWCGSRSLKLRFEYKNEGVYWKVTKIWRSVKRVVLFTHGV